MGRISRDKSRVKRYTHRMGTSVLTALVSTAPYAILPLVYVLLPGRMLPRKTTFHSLSPSDDAIDLDFGKRFSGTFGLDILRYSFPSKTHLKLVLIEQNIVRCSTCFASQNRRHVETYRSRRRRRTGLSNWSFAISATRLAWPYALVFRRQ